VLARPQVARHLLDDYSNGTLELFSFEQLEHIKDKFCELSLLNIRNFIVFFNNHLMGGYKLIGSLN
jgi:hypothetical protein